MATWREEITIEGFLLAILGFGITRLVVAETLRTDAALPFLVGGLLPLAVGLGITIVGVVLAVGSFRQEYTRAITVWAYIGTGAIVVVIGVTTAAAILRAAPMQRTIGSNLLVANVLLGGAVGGAITGVRTARIRRQRDEIKRQVDRTTLINRVLRDEALNATQVVKGYTEVLRERHDINAVDAIHSAAARIETTIENVGSLVDDSSGDLGPVDLSTVVAEELDQFDADSIRTDLPDAALVRGDHRLRTLLRELGENISVATAADPDTAPSVSVEVRDRTVRFRVASPALEIPDRDVELVQDGRMPEYDDPASGFGLQTVRLLVEYYGGEMDIDMESAITITLPRVTETGEPIAPLGVERADLRSAVGAAIIAGVVMGGYLHLTADLLPVIGALYTVPNPIIGWITHLFHSVVFGVLFAAGMGSIFQQYDGVRGSLLVGIGWGIVLWLVAAGVIMPIWLRISGAMAMLPNLTGPGLVSHILWGSILGTLYGLRISEW